MQFHGVTLTDLLLTLLLAAVVWNTLSNRYWLRRVSGRLNRLPKRETGTGHDGAVTYYAPDEP